MGQYIIYVGLDVRKDTPKQAGNGRDRYYYP